MGLHHPQLVPPPQVPITQPVSTLMPLTQEHLLNGRVLEQLAPVSENNGMSTNSVSPHPLQKQPQQATQQMRQQQHQSTIHAEVASLTQPGTPAAPGNTSHAGTPYTSPVPTPTPMHMQADPPPQMTHSQPQQLTQDPNLQRQHLAMLATHLQSTSLDLSHSHPQRSALVNGRQDSTPHGTPHHTPIPSPTPGNFTSPNPTNHPPTLPDQYQLQLIPEAQFKQEVM